MLGIGGKAPLTDEARALLTQKTRNGLSQVFAPKGYAAVIYTMEFPWDVDGAPKTGIGASDAEPGPERLRRDDRSNVGPARAGSFSL